MSKWYSYNNICMQTFSFPCVWYCIITWVNPWYRLYFNYYNLLQNQKDEDVSFAITNLILIERSLIFWLASSTLSCDCFINFLCISAEDSTSMLMSRLPSPEPWISDTSPRMCVLEWRPPLSPERKPDLTYPGYRGY